MRRLFVLGTLTLAVCSVLTMVSGQVCSSGSSVTVAPNIMRPPDITDRNFAQWFQFLVPKPQEMVWKQIPWRTSLWRATVEAQRVDRPVMLFLMNGHPLGTT